MIGFFGANLFSEEFKPNKAHPNGYVKFYRESWPRDTFIMFERLQASSSSLKGNINLKYDDGRTVSLEASSKSSRDLINMFALSKFM